MWQTETDRVVVFQTFCVCYHPQAGPASRDGQGGQALPIDMLGPPHQQAYSFEESGYYA